MYKSKQSLAAFHQVKTGLSAYPNYWDVVVFVVFFMLLISLTAIAKAMVHPYHVGDVLPIFLSPRYLPFYAFLTVTRMFIALLLSFLFTFSMGWLTARKPYLEKFIIPGIDIMQSIPVLGMLSISFSGFVSLFPGSQLGPECAAIFAIFTSQVWNMLLSFYQSLKTLPKELKEASLVFHLTPWQHFWQIEVPFATPALIWNTMISLSAGWFFVVASEAISIANQTITLPGIGSYIAEAIRLADSKAIIYAIVAMFSVILLYDQLIFRPVIQWAQKFTLSREDDAEKMTKPSWIVKLFQKTRLIRFGLYGLQQFILSIAFFKKWQQSKVKKRKTRLPLFRFWGGYKNIASRTKSYICYALLGWLGVLAFKWMVSHMPFTLSAHQLVLLFYLGAITALRIAILIVICVFIWFPIGVWIGLRPSIAKIIQPIIQFLAAFPANLLFPLCVMLVVRYRLNIEIWTAPLMILGTQWYILFNVIAGTLAIPQQLHHASKNLHLSHWLRWRYLFFPAVFPYLMTGMVSAAGGAWNASIVAESITWGSQRFEATGLGALISETTLSGDFSTLTQAIIVMCLYVLVINRCVWRPLYRLAESRFQIQ